MRGSVEAITGYLGVDFTSHAVHYGDLIHEADRAEVWEQVQNAVAAGGSFDLDYRIRTRDGDERWVWERGVGVPGEDGQIRFLEGFVTDVSERHRLAHELEAARHAAVEAERLALLGALTAGLAHDLGTPMTTILGHAQLLERSLEAPRDRDRATRIVDQARQLGDLMERFLSLARTRGGSPARTDLAPLLERSLDFYADPLGRRHIEVERQLATAPSVYAEPGRLEQSLMALLLRAIELMPSGGRLGVSLGTTADGAAEVRVRDTGPPIPTEQRTSLFAPYPADENGRPSVAASIVLVVAKLLIEEDGGSLELVSSDESGTEFRVELPAIE